MNSTEIYEHFKLLKYKFQRGY